MGFLNANLRFTSVADFRGYLATLPRPDFIPVGLTYHNTYRPDESQWAGAASMRSMQTTYEQKVPAWDRGPHVYIAHDTRYDGIFVMTPPNHYGMHAGACNGGPGTRGRFGCELVHDGDASPFSAGLVQLFAETGAALLEYGKVTTPDVLAHRDCMPGRTCPGRYAYAQKPQLIAALAAAMQLHVVSPPPAPIDPVPTARYRVRSGGVAVVRSGTSRAYRIVRRIPAGQPVAVQGVVQGTAYDGDPRWAKLSDREYVHMSALEVLR